MATTPSSAGVLDLLNGFRKSKVLFTLVQLNVPDALSKHGPSTVHELASHLRSSPDGLARLLSAACSLDLLEHSAGKFSNTEATSVYLTSSSPLSLHGYILHSNQLLYPLWAGLETSVQTAQPCWEHAGGRSGAEVWQNTYKSKEDKLRFMRGMHSFAALSAREIVDAIDLSSCRTLVDLGGATGTLAVALCNQHPQLSATVVDLEDVVALATKHFTAPPYLDKPDILQRVSWLAADFFKQQDRIPGADAFLLARIIHDWEESKCRDILNLVYSKLRPGGQLLLCEMLLDDDGLGPPPALLQSLNMLVGWRGRERTVQEYKELLEPVGFVNVTPARTGTYLDVIKAEKPV